MSAHMSDTISNLESLIGYHCIKDPTLLWEALQAAGSPHRFAGDRELIDGNKKLAALGDAVADQWLWLHLFRTSRTKGDCDLLRQDLLSNKNLARIGRSLRIETLLFVSPGLTTVEDSMVATMMEAIIGAVYLDGDMEAVESLMRKSGLEVALLQTG